MLLFSAAACTTVELSQSWQIDRLRVLAVAAEPAEPRPGDNVTFRSLVVSPDVPVAATIWFACLLAEGDYGCDVDPALLDGLSSAEDLDPAGLEALTEAGLIGAEPYWPPTWTVPTDALDELTEAERIEGLTAMVNLTAIPEGDAVDEADLELAYKRVPVSEAATPNHNPELLGIQVDGRDIADGTTVTVDVGQPYTLTVQLADGAVESYTFIDDAGAVETRDEEPYFSWYLQEGSFDQTYDLYPSLEATWYAPETPASDEGTIWVVARDRRGGMGWSSLSVRYRR